MSIYNYCRRESCEVRVGNVGVGGHNPVRLQSMTNTDTADTESSVAQAMRIAAAGGEIVRLTTQGEREARNMEHIRRELESRGCMVPIVADVHFNPKAAFVAAATCHKVRINPGNFADPARTFRHLEYTEEQYAAELDGLRRQLIPFLELCRQNATAVRLGVNHGSLSDRIMSRYGDTPAGMVRSVMEYLEIAREVEFSDIVISIKASSTPVMVATVELLCRELEAAGMNFPLHLGVTEAGNGEDGRVKSAVGIGALLALGLGDTIRVSLSEAPENEIPVAAKLRDYVCSRSRHARIPEPQHAPELRVETARPIEGWPGRYAAVNADLQGKIPDDWIEADASGQPRRHGKEQIVVVTSRHANAPGEIASYIDRCRELGSTNPFVVKLTYSDTDSDDIRIKAGADFGLLLLHGYAAGIWLDAPALDEAERSRLELGLLQAARMRFSTTEYIACPSCGRTLFDLESTLAQVKKATSHLTGLKIGVMGCVVNGPGEMADADYGYVGAGPGRVSIYKGKQLVKKNLPAAEALPALVELIKSCGDWREPND